MALTDDWGWQRVCLWSAWIVLATRSAQLSILSVLRFCFYMKGSFLNNSSLLIVFLIHHFKLHWCCVQLFKGPWHNTEIMGDCGRRRWKGIIFKFETFFKLSRDLSLSHSLSYKVPYTFLNEKIIWRRSFVSRYPQKLTIVEKLETILWDLMGNSAEKCH